MCRAHLAALALLAACAAPAPRPDDMSAAAHRREAQGERQAARADLAASRADQRSEPIYVTESPMLRPGWSDPHPQVGGQGGSPYLHAAEEHVKHAEQHERAARELERFEDAACRDVPVAGRAACPLLHDVVDISDVPGGVSVQFAARISVPEVVTRIRCHLAYARARAFETAAECPLYVRGVRVAPAGSHAIQLTADDRGASNHIRALVREEALPAPDPQE